MQQDEEEEKGSTQKDPKKPQFHICGSKEKEKFGEGGLDINFVNEINQAKI